MVLAIFEVTGVTAVAGATVSGLIIGLGLQQYWQTCSPA
jgi:hypothetical protein